MRQPFKHHIDKRVERLYATIDIETLGLTGKVLFVGIYSDAHGYKVFSTVKEAFKWCLVNLVGYWLYAHNGSGFDFRYFAGEAREHLHTMGKGYQIKTISSGEKLFAFEVPTGNKKAKITFIDSINIFPGTLAKIAKAWAPHLPKLVGDIDFEGGEVPDINNPKHLEYNKRDCEALLESVKGYDKFLWTNHKVNMHKTNGGNAISAVEAALPEDYRMYRQHPDKEAFVRFAQHGGLVYMGVHIDIWLFVTKVDINAAYAQVQKELYPYGCGIWTNVYEPSLFGIYQIRATTPEVCPLQVLFYQDEKGNKCRPIGTFVSFCTSLEIELAVSLGYTFEVLRGIVYPEKRAPYRAFIEKCENIEYPEDGSDCDVSIKAGTKSLRTNSWGKSATRIIQKSLAIFNEEDRPEHADIILDDQGHIAEGVGILTETCDRTYMQPHLGVWTTAMQRVVMFKAILACGVENVAYGDTDSLAVKNVDANNCPLDISSKGYGKWKLEKYFVAFQPNGPKHYWGDYASYDKNGHMCIETDGASKGTPKQKLRMEDLKAAGQGIFNKVEWDSLTPLKKMFIQPDGPLFTHRERHISNFVNSKAYRVVDKKVFPIKIPLTT